MKAAGGLTLAAAAGCRSGTYKWSANQKAQAAAERARYTEAPKMPEGGYPLIDVRGKSYRELGFKIGAAMRGPIRECFLVSADLERCIAFLRDRPDPVRSMLDRTRERFPHLVEELEGMAEGLEMPFLDLFAYNCRSEISLLFAGAGCSTIGLKAGGRVVLAHNEDGDATNMGRMFVARVALPGGVAFMACVYPGLLPGNGPGVNSAGLVQTTNYIQPRDLRDGVPRYFVGRAILEAKTLDEAVAIATAPGRAFSWHHNLVSLPEGRYLSVEACADKFDVLEVEGLYIHTNHLIHPLMTSGNAAGFDVPGESSLNRLRVLRDGAAARGTPAGADEMIALLSLHEGLPPGPCIHFTAPGKAVTLGTAIFEGSEPAMTLIHGYPCESRVRERYTLGG